MESAVNKFYKIIFHSFNIYVLKIKINPCFKHNVSWSNPFLRNCINFKKIAHKQFKLTNFQDDYSIFSKLRRKCKNLSQIAHSIYIIKIENNINKNMKSFWKYIQSLKSNKSNIPTAVFLLSR